MVYWILKDKGFVISRSTVRPSNHDEWLDENEKKAREEIDQAEYSILGKFDESLVHEVPNDEMEEPFAGEEGEDVPEERDGECKNDQEKNEFLYCYGLSNPPLVSS